MILADRDLDTGWISAANSGAEKRYYYLQNWRADTCALVNSAGMVVRNYRYSAYGSRTDIGGADFNRSGATDYNDYLDFTEATGARTDFNRDGEEDFADYLDFVDVFSLAEEEIGGGSIRNLYAGYENDPSLEVAAVSSGGDSALVAYESMYHVRNRAYSTELGRWTRRDPLGYHDGMGLMEYCRSMAEVARDSMGLNACFIYLPLFIEAEKRRQWWREQGVPDGVLGIAGPCKDVATIKNCCDCFRENQRLNEGDFGGVVCCNGVKTACLGLKSPYDDSFIVDNSRGSDAGKGIIDGCILEHEETHKPQISCNHAICGGMRICRPPFDNQNMKTNYECSAYQVQTQCLVRRMAECGNLLPADRDTCKALVNEELCRTCNKEQVNCGNVSPVCKRNGSGMFAPCDYRKGE